MRSLSIDSMIYHHVLIRMMPMRLMSREIIVSGEFNPTKLYREEYWFSSSGQIPKQVESFVAYLSRYSEIISGTYSMDVRDNEFTLCVERRQSETEFVMEMLADEPLRNIVWPIS